MQDYEKLKNETLEKIDSTSNLDELEGVRVESLGKKGSLSLLMKQWVLLNLIKEEKLAKN